MSNRVVDIVERCLRETFCMTSGCEQTALAILAALEKEGAKVMWREPTDTMIRKALAARQDNGQSWFTAIWDAAPRFGEPSG